MSLINTLFGVPLGWLFHFCYQFLASYGLAILLFTLLTKIIVFPVSFASQVNSVKLVKLRPLLEDAKERYGDAPKLHMQEVKKLYKREKYNSFLGVFPLFIQIPIILGVINVMYNPLQHVLRVSKADIAVLSERAAELLGTEKLGYGAQLKIIDLVKHDASAFASLVNDNVLAQIANFDLNFLGINLSLLPTFNSPALVVVVLSVLSALLMCVVQNRYNVLSAEQGAWGKWGVTAFLVGFSGYFTFVVPAGIGLFWIASNLLAIVVTFACNLVYNPKKYIDYENRSQKKVALTKEEKAAKKQEKQEAKAREKADVARFYAAKKQLVFYSESSGFYKYFSGIIEYILKNSDITVHYVASDLRDQVFALEHPRFKAYYVAGNALIGFMMRMDADMVVMTMPDLQQYHIKRSLVRKDVEYVYLDHGMTSFHMMLRECALDHYDTIFCYGPNHAEEIRAMEKLRNLPAKKLVNTGYSLLDRLLKDVEGMAESENPVKTILIAPSWQKDNLLEFCLCETIEPLLGRGYQIVVRPHPEFVKRFPGKMKAIVAQYGNREVEGLVIEADFSSNKTVYSADLVITDWSSIAQEFSYATKKPSLFINTPMKIINPEYKKIPLEPLDISLRDEIGISVDVEDLGRLPEIAADLLARQAEFKEHITRVLEANIFNIGRSDRASGEYIITTIQEKNKKQP